MTGLSGPEWFALAPELAAMALMAWWAGYHLGQVGLRGLLR